MASEQSSGAVEIPDSGNTGQVGQDRQQGDFGTTPNFSSFGAISGGGIANLGPNTPSSSSKRANVVSANHLLNFQLPPREQHHSYQGSSGSSSKSRSIPAYNKERFVNAKYCTLFL